MRLLRGLTSRLSSVPLILLPFLNAVLALQANLVGIVDWHKPLIGCPLLEPTPPSLTDTLEGRRFVTITRKNVLAVLDAQSGGIVWRHLLPHDEPVVSYHVQAENVLLLSGPSATTARLFSLSTGHVIWERILTPQKREAHLSVPAHLGTDAAFTGEEEGSVVVLNDGRRVSKIDLKSGELRWSLEAPGVGDTITFKQLLVTGQTVHLLALTNSLASLTLSTMSLDLSTSAPLSDLTQIPSFVANPDDASLAIGSGTGVARVLWYEHGRIRSAYLSAVGQLGDTKDLLPNKGRKYTGILSTGARKKGFVLGQKANGAVDVVDVRSGAKVTDVFESSEDSPDRSSSVYSYAETEDGVLFSRMYWSFGLKMAVAQAKSISSTGDIVTSGYTFPFDTTLHGVVIQAAPSTTSSPSQMPDLVLTTSSGAVQLVKQDVNSEYVKWIREESLADIAAVRLIDLGEPEVEETRHLLMEESFSGRVTRHFIELGSLPGYLIRFGRRFTSASYSSAIATAPLSLHHLHRDQFGFQKLLLAVTTGGRVFAMDSTNGNILWSRNLGKFTEHGADLDVTDMWTVRELGETGPPTLAILAVQGAADNIRTMAFHIDAFTGKVAGETDSATGLALGTELFAGSAKTAFLLPFENCSTNNRVLAVVDGTSRLHIFPSCQTVASDIAAMASKLFFTTTDRTLDGTVVKGLTPSSSAAGTSFNTAPMWSMVFAPGETVLSIDPGIFNAIASFGRVLGNKSTLYKYLNPHLTVITTLSSSGKTGHVYVVDSTTGTTVYSAAVTDITPGTGMNAALLENWLVFAWQDETGYRLVSTELFENRNDTQVETPGLSSFSADHTIQAISQTFILQNEVKALGFTTSKFGITAKELVYVTGRNQIAAIPRRLLDPRRPVGILSSGDKEEMLIPYDPLLPIDVKRIISHKNEVLGATSLAFSPALVESTSLVLAYGLDLFLTRGLNPSGMFDILSDNFNKEQLLLTLAALSAGIFIAKPAVQRKILGMRWY